MVQIYKGKWVIKWYAKKASTAFTKNELVELASGYVQPATSTSIRLLGVNQDNTVSSGSATTVKIPILVPVSRAASVKATTSTTVVVGGQYDLTDSVTVNQGASTYDPLTAVEVFSATLAAYAFTYAQT